MDFEPSKDFVEEGHFQGTVHEIRNVCKNQCFRCVSCSWWEDSDDGDEFEMKVT